MFNYDDKTQKKLKKFFTKKGILVMYFILRS